MRFILIGLSLAALAQPLAAATPKPTAKKDVPAKKAVPKIATPARAATDPTIARAVADPGRSDANRNRDVYRHPGQTLTFFGLKPDMTVVEMVPGGGWYSEILAPFLADQGHYVAAVPPGSDSETFQAFLGANPDRYAKVQTVSFTYGQPTALVAQGTADMILTFRNIHNLLGSPEQPGDGNAPQAFTDWFAALKPGGVLGIVEHRLPERMDSAREKTTGYVKRSTVIRLALAAGFQFAGASEINANPRDTHDWPKGVWTLPPSYELGETDHAKYAAIGESDRMTLKFVKPDPNAPDPNAPPATEAAAAPDAGGTPAATRLDTDPAALGDTPPTPK